MAEFRRFGASFHLRFPAQADFELVPQDGGRTFSISAWPAPQCPERHVLNLYHNAITPLIGNHSGGLFLHGSAVRILAEGNGPPGAIAFLGLSRGGKTTLAGAFAKAGHAFLTEDVIDLERREGSYFLQPKRSKLRLFADSARHLLGQGSRFDNEDAKQDIDGGEELPFASSPVPLRQIYVLGTNHAAPISVREFTLQSALSSLIPHAFVLDVEDRARLAGHFARMADLSQDIGCYALDYPRRYAELPRVLKAVLDNYHSD